MRFVWFTFLVGASGWCLEDEKGPCRLNIRSKAGGDVARSVALNDSQDGWKSVVAFTPNEKELLFFVGNTDEPKGGCVRITENGFLKTGDCNWKGRKDPTRHLEVTSETTTALARISGKGQVCAALTLANIENDGAFTLLFDGEELGFLGKASASDARDASMIIHAKAPPRSVAVTDSGALLLQQTGNHVESIAKLRLAKSRGSNPSARQIVFKDDVVGVVGFEAFDGSKQDTIGALKVSVEKVVAAGKIAGRVDFQVKGDTESGLATKMTMYQDKVELVGATDLVLERGSDLIVQDGAVELMKGKLSVGGRLQVTEQTELKQGLVVSGGDISVLQAQLLLEGKSGFIMEQGDMKLSQGNLYVHGAATIDGPLSVQEALVADKTLQVKGTTSMEGDVNVGAALQVKGDVTIADSFRLEGGQATFTGPLSILHSGRFSVQRDANPSSSPLLDCEPQASTCSIAGKLATPDLEVSNSLVLSGADFRMDSGKSFSIESDASFKQQTSFHAPVIIEPSSPDQQQQTDGLTVRASASVEKSLRVGEALHIADARVEMSSTKQLEIHSAVNVMDGLQVGNGGLLVLRGSSEETALRVSNEDGSTTVFGKLHAKEDVTFNGHLSCDSTSIENNLTVSGQLTIRASPQDVHQVGGTFEMDHLTVKADANIEGTLTVSKGDVSIKKGQLSTTDVVATTLTVTDTLHLRPIRTEHNANEMDPRIILSSEQGIEVVGVAKFSSPDQHIDLTSNVSVTGAVHIQSGELLLGSVPLKHDSQEQQLSLGDTLTLHLGASSTQVRSVNELSLESKDAPLAFRGTAIDLQSYAGAFTASSKESLQLTCESETKQAAALTLSPDAFTISFSKEKDPETALHVAHEKVHVPGTDAVLSVKTVHTDTFQCGSEPVTCLSFQESDKTLNANQTLVTQENLLVGSTLTLRDTQVVLEAPQTTLDVSNGSFFLLKTPPTITTATAAAQSKLGEKPLVTLELQNGHTKALGSLIMVSNLAPVPVVLAQDAGHEPHILIPASSSSLLLFDGVHWVAPYASRMETISLYDVTALVANNDLNIGNVTLSAGSLQVQRLANEEVSEVRQRLALVDAQGELKATAEHHLAIDHDGTLRVSKTSGFTVTGDIDVAGNTMKNVTIDGGKIRGVTELQVKADFTVQGSISETSDERTKTNVKPLNAALCLQQILQLQGVFYQTKKDSAAATAPGQHEDQTNIGLIAQQVESVIPEVVSTAKDDEGGLKSIQYARLVPVLIESIKSLEERVRQLEQRLGLTQPI